MTNEFAVRQIAFVEYLMNKCPVCVMTRCINLHIYVMQSPQSMKYLCIICDVFTCSLCNAFEARMVLKFAVDSICNEVTS